MPEYKIKEDLLSIDWHLMKMRDWCIAVDKKKTITETFAYGRLMYKIVAFGYLICLLKII